MPAAVIPFVFSGEPVVCIVSQVYGKIFCFILKMCFQLNTMTAVTAVLRLTTSADHPPNDRNTSLFTYANHSEYI